MRFGVVLLALGALVAWLHAPLRHGGVLGADGTDVVRAIWGFDLQARSLPGLGFTTEVMFPEGVRVLVLPFVSSMLGWPLHAALGPFNGYTAWVLVLAWAGPAALAAWVYQRTTSLSAGFLAGAAMVVQPLVLLAETEGTPEHLAYWSLPLAFLCLDRARGTRAAAYGLAAGVLATVLALDNPYAAIFAVPLTLPVLAGTERRGGVAFLAACVAGACLTAYLYRDLSLHIGVPQRDANATSLLTWADWDAGIPRKPWDFTHPPAFLPGLGLVLSASLGLAAGRKGWGWLGLAACCFALSLGSAQENAVVMHDVLGPIGAALGDGISWFNQAFAPDLVRFPRRWLIPCALCLWTAAAFGVARFKREWQRSAAVACILALTVQEAMDKTGFRIGFPTFSPNVPAFVSYLASMPPGAVVLLPAQPPNDAFGLRRVPAHSVIPLLQVLVGKASVNAPPALLTVGGEPATRGSPAATLLASAWDSPASVEGLASSLVKLGVRYVALDEESVSEDDRVALAAALRPGLAESRHFDDGAGVTVLVLRP